MSEGILSVNPAESYSRNPNWSLIKKHEAHYADAQKIVKSRMKSVKQIEEQAYDYSITATKKRNKYLNELFDYIADIHKAEIKKGKKHHSAYNYDVLELYQKINGYNEKEFQRMLRARTPEGTRMYSFKEINKMLDDSMVEHFRILREQQASTRASRLNRPVQAISTEPVPRERALTVISNNETFINMKAPGITLKEIQESAHNIMAPKETSNVIDELRAARKAGSGAPGISSSIEEEIQNVGKEAKRSGKGWIGVAIAAVLLITALVIRNQNKKKAQNINVNA